jgi:hypothetical protein
VFRSILRRPPARRAFQTCPGTPLYSCVRFIPPRLFRNLQLHPSHFPSLNSSMTCRNSLHLVGILQALSSVPNQHSIPIAQRVRRNRQRLPSSLLIENVSEPRPRLTNTLLPEAFPIKASDHSAVDADI